MKLMKVYQFTEANDPEHPWRKRRKLVEALVIPDTGGLSAELNVELNEEGVYLEVDVEDIQ